MSEEKLDCQRGKSKKIVYPKRAPSVVVPARQIVYITADKITCVACQCYPYEEPYQVPKKLRPCQRTPPTLYELASLVLDSTPRHFAFAWSVEDVCRWMTEQVGLPQYTECIVNNKINGLRLLMLEDPSKLPSINITNFEHIKKITDSVRALYRTESVMFARSIGLPPRYPLTHTTWFHSRTGPVGGIRVNWSRTDILRWMKVLDPKPIYRDHWDLVWYQKPDFPKTSFARVPWKKSSLYVPHYVETEDVCWEYKVPRKFRLERNIPDSQQFIWMEHRPQSIMEIQKEQRKLRKIEAKRQKQIKRASIADRKVALEGLRGNAFILARRLLPKPKFYVKKP